MPIFFGSTVLAAGNESKMLVTMLVNCQLVPISYFHYQSVPIRAANKQSWCYVMYGSERERRGPVERKKEKGVDCKR